MFRMETTQIHILIIFWYHVDIVKYDTVVIINFHDFLKTSVHYHCLVELSFVKLENEKSSQARDKAIQGIEEDGGRIRVGTSAVGSLVRFYINRFLHNLFSINRIFLKQMKGLLKCQVLYFPSG